MINIIFKYFWIFVLGCTIGFVYETILEYFQTGLIFSKQELVFFPFICVYGMGAIVFSVIANSYKNMSVIFLISAFLGGVLEYLYSFFEEKLFGTISWNYSNAILNIDGRTTILYCIGWGILGVIYARFVYPKISKFLKNQKSKVYFIISTVAIILIIIVISITTLSSIRYYQRRCGKSSNRFI